MDQYFSFYVQQPAAGCWNEHWEASAENGVAKKGGIKRVAKWMVKVSIKALSIRFFFFFGLKVYTSFSTFSMYLLTEKNEKKILS